MNLLKKYRDRLEAAICLGGLPVALAACYVLDLCKHC